MNCTKCKFYNNGNFDCSSGKVKISEMPCWIKAAKLYKCNLTTDLPYLKNKVREKLLKKGKI
jgi:hypothetical protein